MGHPAKIKTTSYSPQAAIRKEYLMPRFKGWTKVLEHDKWSILYNGKVYIITCPHGLLCDYCAMCLRKQMRPPDEILKKQRILIQMEKI